MNSGESLPPPDPSAVGPAASFFSFGCNVSCGFSPEAQDTRRPSPQRIPRCTNKKQICLRRFLQTQRASAIHAATRRSRPSRPSPRRPQQKEPGEERPPKPRHCPSTPRAPPVRTKTPVLVALPGFSHTNQSQLSTGNAKLPCSKG